jgi:hypothetical protein
MKLRLILGGLLALSLGANAFLAGWLLSPSAEAPAVASERAAPMRALLAELRALPQPERGQALAIVRSRGPELRRQAAELRAARARLGELLTAETVDRDAAEAAFAELRTRNLALQQGAQAMILEIAEGLDASTRTRLIARMGAGR